MSSIPHIELFKKNKAKIFLGAVIFWFVMGLMIYVTEVIANKYFGTQFLDGVEKRQYFIRGFLWLLLTPLIIYLGLKINVGNIRIVWFVLLHLFLGTVLLVLEFCIEASITKPMAEAMYGRQVGIGELAIPFLFKYFAYITIYFLLIGIVNIYVYMSRFQNTQKDLHQFELQNKELKYQVTLSQLQALKMQIHPHFLFNTHHSIIGLIIKKENDMAAQMLTKLSDLLRLTIEKQSTEFVTLKEEMRIIDLYLEIQQIRFLDRFTFTKNISSEAANFLVPYFILQPLVENAIVHGVEKLDENAFIKINATLKNDLLVIEIINNCSEDDLPVKTIYGIGLSNITERLKQYYGSNASFALSKDSNKNTAAILNIPVYEK